MNNEQYNLLIRTFKFLEKSGFIPDLISEKLTEELSIDILRYSKDNIRIDLMFNIFSDCKHITVTIGQYDTESSFDFDEYLLFKGEDKKLSRGLLSDSNEAYLRNFKELFMKHLDNGLQDVITGKKWIKVPKDYSRTR